MIRIRAEQMSAFRRYQRKRFEDQMVSYMKKSSKNRENLSEAQIRERVVFLIASAESHRIVHEDDVQVYIELFFHRLPEIRQNTDVKDILESQGISSSTKIAFLVDILNLKGNENEH
jgi:hypothetical protein